MYMHCSCKHCTLDTLQHSRSYSMQYGIARDLQCIELVLIVKCLAIANQKCLIMHAEHIYMC